MTKETSIKHINKQEEIKRIENKINATTDSICRNRLEQLLFNLERELEDMENN